MPCSHWRLPCWFRAWTCTLLLASHTSSHWIACSVCSSIWIFCTDLDSCLLCSPILQARHTIHSSSCWFLAAESALHLLYLAFVSSTFQFWARAPSRSPCREAPWPAWSVYHPTEHNRAQLFPIAVIGTYWPSPLTSSASWAETDAPPPPSSWTRWRPSFSNIYWCAFAWNGVVLERVRPPWNRICLSAPHTLQPSSTSGCWHHYEFLLIYPWCLRWSSGHFASSLPGCFDQCCTWTWCRDPAVLEHQDLYELISLEQTPCLLLFARLGRSSRCSSWDQACSLVFTDLCAAAIAWISWCSAGSARCPSTCQASIETPSWRRWWSSDCSPGSWTSSSSADS